MSAASVPGSAAWWRGHEERLARRRPHTDGLTLEVVLAEALALVDAEGMEALTVRALAARLGTGSSTPLTFLCSVSSNPSLSVGTCAW